MGGLGAGGIGLAGAPLPPEGFLGLGFASPFIAAGMELFGSDAPYDALTFLISASLSCLSFDSNLSLM